MYSISHSITHSPRLFDVPGTEAFALENLDALGYIYNADSMGLAAVNLMQLAAKAAVLCAIMANGPFKVAYI